MTGLPMPVVIEMERSPGVPWSVSPMDAPCAVRSALPPPTVAGWVLRSACVATALAETCTALSSSAVSRIATSRVTGASATVRRRTSGARPMRLNPTV